MRRLLTAYSVYYNRRYKRSGHLFQNRYRSIICEEDPYFTELVRYIHLNPVRGGIIKDLLDLERYPWSGHRILMGREKASWQNLNEVLSYFDKTMGRARLKYQRFLLDGMQQGRRPDFSGERLILFGIKNREDQQAEAKGVMHDRRILGKVEFAQKILSHHRKIPETKILPTTWEHLLKKTVDWFNLSENELVSGSKRQPIVHARCILSYLAVRNLGMRATEVAQLLKVSQPAISKCLLRGEEIIKKDEKVLNEFIKEVMIS